LVLPGYCQGWRAKPCRRTKSLAHAVAEINLASHPSALQRATTAILGVCGGLRGFAKHYAAQFNAAAYGSQMRTSILLAGVRLLLQCVEELDASDVNAEEMSDEELAAYRGEPR